MDVGGDKQRESWWEKRVAPLTLTNGWVVIGTDDRGNLILRKGNTVLIMNLN